MRYISQLNNRETDWIVVVGFWRRFNDFPWKYFEGDASHHRPIIAESINLHSQRKAILIRLRWFMPRVSEEIGDRDGCVKSRGWVAVSNKQTRVFAEWEVDVMKKPRRNLISDRFYWILGGETRRNGGRCGWRGSFFLAFRASEEISLKRDLLKFREPEGGFDEFVSRNEAKNRKWSHFSDLRHIVED